MALEDKTKRSERKAEMKKQQRSAAQSSSSTDQWWLTGEVSTHNRNHNGETKNTFWMVFSLNFLATLCYFHPRLLIFTLNKQNRPTGTDDDWWHRPNWQVASKKQHFT